MKISEILGFIAGALTTFAFIPGVILIWSMKPTPAIAISLLMYSSFCLGVLCWFIFGIMIKSRPVIFWNFVTLCLASTILVYKYMYG